MNIATEHDPTQHVGQSIWAETCPTSCQWTRMTRNPATIEATAGFAPYFTLNSSKRAFVGYGRTRG